MEWEDRVLSGIFKLTLDPEVEEDSHGQHLTYVKNVREDLEEQGEPVRLGTTVLDQAILEAASNAGKTAPLEYLLGCWKRVSKQFKAFRGEKSSDPHYDVIKEARRLCMSYCLFAVTMPEMFGREPSPTNVLSPHLLVDPEDDRGLCHEFLAEAISRFEEDDTIQAALVSAVEELCHQLTKMSMNDNFKPYVLVRALIATPSSLAVS